MKYIIAPKESVVARGIKPTALTTKEQQIVLNENELRYNFPQISLEEATELVNGVIVDRTTALDFLYDRKNLETIKNSIDNE